MSFRSLITTCFGMTVLLSGTVAAQDPRPGEPDFAAPQPMRIQSTGHYGSSPFAPPKRNDSTFVVDQGPGLDTGCTFRSGGPLRFEILVDRALENASDVSKLKEQGLISDKATIRMPAYDIDFDGGGGSYAPERNRVFFNGRVVPEEFLTGANNIWKLNAFQVPIEWVKFREAGSGIANPGRNEIEIRIDTANTEEVWCTSVDWASLSFRAVRPAVMAHGILSNSSIWNSLWVPRLRELGIQAVQYGINPDMGALDSIGNNAAKIAAAVASAKERWGVDKVSLVTHSKGGLDSRHFAENSDSVENLVQLGTPNAGSPLADVAQGIVLRFGNLPGTLISALAAPAGIQLTQPYMALYNRMHGYNPAVRYSAVAGDYTPDCRFCTEGMLTAIVRRGDTVVPVRSVHALPYITPLTHPSTGRDDSATHSGLHQSAAVYGLARPGVTRVSQQSLAMAQAYEDESARSASAVGSLAAGEVQRRTVAVDQIPAMISMLYQGGDLDMTLISPSGRRIDPAAATSGSGIEFAEGEILGGRQAAYSLLNTERGEWTVEVGAASVPSAGTPVGYAVNAWFTDPAVTLQGSFARASIATGEALVLRATVSERGTLIRGASVQARVAMPAGGRLDVTLHDDGRDGDASAGDGVYSTTVHALEQAGLYKVLFVAHGSTAARHPFSREMLELATVSAGQARFTGFRDAGLDVNANGYFDELRIEADVNVDAPGRYRVFAVLTDSAGTAYPVSVVQELAAGANTLALSFDGRALYQARVDGPYTLSTIRLAQEGELELLPVADVGDAHRTAAYSYRQFEHERIELNGTSVAMGADTNGNGRYDLLDVAIGVDLERAGFYQWSAQLSDSDGKRIGFFAGSSYLDAGRGELLFSFDGEAIGRNGKDAPYLVTELLVFGGGASLVAEQAFTAESFRASHFEGFVGDITPPTLELSVDPSVLWPANHRMVPVKVDVRVSDDTDPQPRVTLVSVESNEANNGQGDGNSTGDIQGAEPGTDDRSLLLRAERSGSGFDRIYTLTYEARDASGNATTAQATVTVPHDRR